MTQDIFRDRVILITGAAQGIGFACADYLSGLGAKICMIDVDKNGHQAAEKIKAEFYECDVTRKADITATLKTITERHGKIDGLINNAAILHKAPFLELSEQDFDRVLSVNLKGSFLMGQAVAQQMVRQIENKIETLNSIVNMSSVNAVLAIPDITPYVVSKGGLNQLTKVMALSLAPHGIRVNGIGPGSIETEMLKSVMNNEAARHMILSRTPIGRAGQPHEIASVAAFLLGSESSYITGQTIYADGGRLGLNYTVSVSR